MTAFPVKVDWGRDVWGKGEGSSGWKAVFISTLSDSFLCITARWRGYPVPVSTFKRQLLEAPPAGPSAAQGLFRMQPFPRAGGGQHMEDRQCRPLASAWLLVFFLVCAQPNALPAEVGSHVLSSAGLRGYKSKAIIACACLPAHPWHLWPWASHLTSQHQPQVFHLWNKRYKLSWWFS